MYDFSTILELGKLVTTIIAVLAAVWAFQMWRARDELFPRVLFEVSVNFIGIKGGKVICEFVAILENKGIVPLELQNLNFTVRGLSAEDKLEVGGDEIRGQLNFNRKLVEGSFVPKGWNFTFIYPDVRTEYNFVATIPESIEFIRMQGDFDYIEPDRSHSAAKVLAVPTIDQMDPCQKPTK